MRSSLQVSLSSVVLVLLLISNVIVLAQDASDKAVISKCKDASDRGIRFLTKQQHKDGSYGMRPCVGITSLCVRAMATSHRKYRLVR